MLGRTLVVAAWAGALALSGCGAGGPAHEEPPPNVDAAVTMEGVAFNPTSLRIQSGDTVQWRNTTNMTHTVTADPRLAADPANVQLPQGAEPFHSGTVAAGQVWTHTFNVPGTYRYVCQPHEQQGMMGTVVVE
jgi:plastocyanin